MSYPADKARALAIHRRLDRHMYAFLDWQAQPSFREAFGSQRGALRTAAIEFVRAMEASGCPARLAVTLASITYGAAEVSIRRWIRRMKSAPPGAAEVPMIKPLGRPPRAWSAPGAESAYRAYRLLYGSRTKKNSAETWRTVKALTQARGLTIPCEAMFRLRLRREAKGGR